MDEELLDKRLDVAGVRPMLEGDLAAHRAEQQRRAEAGEAVIDIDPSIEYGSPYRLAVSPAAAAAPAAPSVPLQEPPSVPTADLQQQLDRARATGAAAYAAPGAPEFSVPMVGAGQLGLAKEYETGIKRQQSALEDLRKAYQSEETGIAAKEEGYLKELERYRGELGKLDTRRRGMTEARNFERRFEQQQLEAARMGFDANRVYEDLAKSPLQVGILAAVSGIVQGMQGYAGDDKPNVVLKAIEDAARRDVTNQVEQYRRMVQGQEFSKNAFIEARQVLGDDQQALQVATMATLDQFKKGLEFTKDRMSRAKDRAVADQTIGQLDTAVAEAKTALRTKQAELDLQASMANQRAELEKQKILQEYNEAQSKFGAANMKAASDKVEKFSLTDDGRAMTEELNQIARTGDMIQKAVASGRSIEQLLTRDVLDNVRDSLLSSAAGAKNDQAAWRTAFQQKMATAIGKADPEKAAVLTELQNLFVAHLRAQAGKAQSVQETANTLRAADLQTAAGALKFMDRLRGSSEAMINQQIQFANQVGDSALAAAWTAMYMPKIISAKTPFEALTERTKMADELARRATQGQR